MNKKYFIALGIIILGIVGWFLLMPTYTKDSSRVDPSDMYTYETTDEPSTTTPLSTLERDGLVFMREEEKLAHDVYTTLYATWGIPAFKNIAESEATHTEAVRALLEQFNIDDPAATRGPGVFADANMQSLYNALVDTGKKSRLDALMVGAEIEDLDIKDLQDRLAQTIHPDIQRVYQNLMKGSRNHLRSFSSLIEKEGGTYTARHLSPEEVAAIVQSPKERGPAVY